MNVGQLREALAGVPDDYGLYAYEPGDPTVGIFPAEYEISEARSIPGKEGVDPEAGWFTLRLDA